MPNKKERESNIMAERQKHGFDFQDYIINKYSLTEYKGIDHYTHQWDAYYNEIPVSIKHIKYKSEIDLADFFRNSKINKDFIMIVGFYKNNNFEEDDIHILNINGDDWSKLFNSSSDPDFLDKYTIKLKDLLDTITNHKDDDSKWKSQIKILKKEWSNNTPNIVRPRFKRDHKVQKRIQCAINYNDFIQHFKKYRGVL
jgi:hypothetical protein